MGKALTPLMTTKTKLSTFGLSLKLTMLISYSLVSINQILRPSGLLLLSTPLTG